MLITKAYLLGSSRHGLTQSTKTYHFGTSRYVTKASQHKVIAQSNNCIIGMFLIHLFHLYSTRLWRFYTDKFWSPIFAT